MPFDINSLLNTRITETRLEAVRYVMQQRIDVTLLRGHADLDVFIDQTGRYLALQLEATFYGSRPDRYEERMDVPADWWSHFKAWAIQRNAWWTRWVRRLAKPRMRTLVFTAEGHLLFPDISFTTRDRHHTIMVADTHLDWAK
jgi:hypothetical protein